MSLSTSSTLWSEQQREWLQALGHDVLVLAATDAPTAAVPAPGPIRREDQAKPAGPGAPAQPAVASNAGPDGPLLRALARAAGRPLQDAEFLRALPDLSTLRGNPAARRALWPQLRALRRAGAK